MGSPVCPCGRSKPSYLIVCRACWVKAPVKLRAEWTQAKNAGLLAAKRRIAKELLTLAREGVE